MMSRALLLLLLLGSAQAADPIVRRLQWDYPADLLSTSLTFRIYSHTNVTVPLTNWPVTEVVGTQTWVNVALIPERRFWTVVASNYWGEFGEPSNIADVPHPTLKTTNTLLTKP